MEKLKQYAERNDFSYKVIVNNSAESAPVGVLISTDYCGAYPPAEVYALHNVLRSYAAKHGLRFESRGFHTGAALIMEG